jgi:hypothetical protein
VDGWGSYAGLDNPVKTQQSEHSRPSCRASDEATNEAGGYRGALPTPQVVPSRHTPSYVVSAERARRALKACCPMTFVIVLTVVLGQRFASMFAQALHHSAPRTKGLSLRRMRQAHTTGARCCATCSPTMGWVR